MDDPREVILRVLEIIDYQDDKEKFTQDFLNAIHKKAISNCVGALSEEQKNSLETQLTGVVRSPEEVGRVLFQFITEDDYKVGAQKAAEEIMRGYLEAISSTLSENQTNKLKKYFNSF
ncbi:hypothetical protein A3A45_02105 [Candidatus Daviesbacteria bacterium RIFCSPLOWO2_01_FULL_36_8]|nr:MAG: hypothetical protein A3A45_02105 [Candidatus Daviesbacteria bacterium RIFCSPLOWO2_01_FULL_36_8]